MRGGIPLGEFSVLSLTGDSKGGWPALGKTLGGDGNGRDGYSSSEGVRLEPLDSSQGGEVSKVLQVLRGPEPGGDLARPIDESGLRDVSIETRGYGIWSQGSGSTSGIGFVKNFV